MKYKLTSVETTILSLLIVLLCSCQKNDVFTSNDPINQPPKALAGNDTFIILPVDSVFLSGNAVTNNDIVKVEWRKITGPNSNILTPNSLQTSVNGLQQGVYLFELTVTNTKKLTGKDTIEVAVISNHTNTNTNNINSVTGPGFIIFKNLEWKPIWYFNLEIPNINTHVSLSNPIKVFVQRSHDTTWIEVKHFSNSSDDDQYDYFIETRPHGAGMYNFGSLYINYYGYYNNIPTDRPSVKIEF